MSNLRTYAELQPGDWTRGPLGDWREVRHIEPVHRRDDGLPIVMVVLAGGEALYPFADDTATLATPEDLDAAKADARRAELAAQLRALADEIEANALPAPRYALRLAGCVETRGDVQRWADHLGVTVRMGGTDDNIPVVETTRPYGDARLTLAFQSPAEQKTAAGDVRGVPADASGEGPASSGPDAAAAPSAAVEVGEPPAADGVTPEHGHAAGWGGEPGSYGVACMCGLTYDGFDSLAEASALLDQHIADAVRPAVAS